MVNVVGAVYDKSNGEELAFYYLPFLFEVPDGYRSADPKVIYDSFSGRFFATYISLCESTPPPPPFPPSACPGGDVGLLHFAASTTSDPTQPWNVYFIQIPNDFPDYPGLGVSDDKVTVSYNRFDIDAVFGFPPPYSPGCDPGGYCGVQTLVVQKSDLVNGVMAPLTFGPFPGGLPGPGDLDHFTVRPAHSLTSPSSTQYMASVTYPTAPALHVWGVTGTPALANVVITDLAHPSVAGGFVSPCPFRFSPGPGCARQAGTADRIHTGDNRLIEAVWRNGRMWVSATTECIPSGDSAVRACLKLVEVDTSTNGVTQNITFGTSGAYYFYPAIRTDASGNLHVVFSRSSSSTFVAAGVAGRLFTDPANTMSGLCILKSGEIPYTQDPELELDSSPYRWGDYMGAAVDPANPSVVWVVGQYANNDPFEHWGTHIGKLQYPATGCPYGGDGDCDGDVDAVDALRILRAIAGLPNTLPPGCVFNGNVDCDSDTDAVDALRVLRDVAGLGNTLPPGCPPISPP